MANNIFDFKRFGRYFASDFRSAVSNYWLSCTVLALSPAVAELLTGLFSLIFTGEWGSPVLAARIALAVCIGAVTLVTVPAKLYGHVTDRKSGPNFIELPVSVFEKSSSMILNAAVIVPLLTLLLFLAADGLLCLIDPGCGKALICSAGEILGTVFTQLGELPEELQGIRGILNPVSYVDDMIQLCLIFLLGAVFFKKNKIVKTIAAIIGISIVASGISSPIMMHQLSNLEGDVALEMLTTRWGWFFNNLALIDTISDTVVNLLLSLGIYFRIKTIKF